MRLPSRQLFAQGSAVTRRWALYGGRSIASIFGIWLGQYYSMGKEMPKGNSGDLGKAKKRQRRRWFSLKYYASVMRLQVFYEEHIGRKFCGVIANMLNEKVLINLH